MDTQQRTGLLAVQRGLLAPGQLEQALAQRGETPLLDWLRQRDWLTHEQERLLQALLLRQEDDTVRLQPPPPPPAPPDDLAAAAAAAGGGGGGDLLDRGLGALMEAESPSRGRFVLDGGEPRGQ